MAVKFTLAALVALLSKVLPKALFNRALYKLTGRKTVWFLSALVMLGLTLWLSSASANDRPAGIPEEARYAKVDRVVDGDTIVLMDRTRVRLEGIDAPEKSR